VEPIGAQGHADGLGRGMINIMLLAELTCQTNPLRASADSPLELRITQDYIDRLEAWCDQSGDPLPNLKSFIVSVVHWLLRSCM
jgi:hypothetical protein